MRNANSKPIGTLPNGTLKPFKILHALSKALF